MSKQTAVEFLVIKFKEIVKVFDIDENQLILLLDAIKTSKEMEKQQSQNYAIFAIRCDRTEMRILDFNDYIKLVKNEEK
jgi:penicillin-binding protein-related factor A (putative recombinase)